MLNENSLTNEISFIVDSLYQSQQSFFLINELNNAKINATVFVENLSPFCLKPEFPVMQAAEAWAKPGIMIATTPATAHKILAFPGPDRKVFYSWDLWWLRGRQRMYEPYLKLYGDARLEIIVRSESHKRAVENAFNIKVAGIVEDFNMGQFMVILNKEIISGNH